MAQWLTSFDRQEQNFALTWVTVFARLRCSKDSGRELSRVSGSGALATRPCALSNRSALTLALTSAWQRIARGLAQPTFTLTSSGSLPSITFSWLIRWGWAGLAGTRTGPAALHAVLR